MLERDVVDYRTFDAITVGRACKYYRSMRMGKTQADVAGELGISREVVNRFENGTFNSFKLLFYYIDNGLLDYLPLGMWHLYHLPARGGDDAR